MAAEGAIIGGLSVISAILGYFAFSLNESTSEISKKVSVLLAFMSLVFLNLVMFSLQKIAAVNTPYLVDSILNTGLFAMIWVTIILVIVLGLGLFWILIKTFKEMYDNNSGKKTREDSYNE